MSLRTSLVLLLLLVLVAGYLAFARLRPAPAPPDAPRIAPWFYTVTEEDILGVAVSYQDKEYAFVQGATRSEWYFADPYRTPVDLDRWGGTPLLLSGPRSNRLLIEKPEDLSPYGLTPPQGWIKLRRKVGQEVTVLLGNRTEDGANHYVQLEGTPQVYLVDSSWADLLTTFVTRPPYPQWYFQGPADKVWQLEVTQGASKVAFVRDQRQGWQFNTSDLPSERPPVDSKRWDAEVLPLLSGPSLQYQAEPEIKDMEKYGLEKPASVLRIGFITTVSSEEGPQEGFRTLEWSLGAKTEDGKGYYAKLLGFPPLVALDAAWVESLLAVADNPPRAATAAAPSAEGAASQP